MKGGVGECGQGRGEEGGEGERGGQGLEGVRGRVDWGEGMGVWC